MGGFGSGRWGTSSRPLAESMRRIDLAKLRLGPHGWPWKRPLQLLLDADLREGAHSKGAQREQEAQD
jgi:hypothetical protein